MEPTWERLADPEAHAAWEGVLRPLADELGDNAAALSHQIVEFIAARLPELFADDEAAEENRASTEANIRAVAQMITSGFDPNSIELPPATLAYAHSSVRRGIPYSILARSYRLGHEAAWSAVFAGIAARSGSEAELAQAAGLGSVWLFDYIDRALVQSESVYDEERQRWLRTAAAVQAETIADLLAGRERDAGQASARLRYPLDRHHVAAVAWLDESVEAGSAHALLDAAVQEVAAALGTPNPLVRPAGQLALDVWFGAAEQPAVAALDSLRLAPPAGANVRVAFGEPAFGIDGFAASHSEAGHARRVAMLAGRGPGTITRYGRIALAALATVDIDQAHQFAERQLGQLLADDDVSLRLAATLQVYLEENASRSRAAKRLGIHENTITYRVRQAEEVLGHRVDENSLELRVALALLPMLRNGASAQT